jgi:hypothetical protein
MCSSLVAVVAVEKVATLLIVAAVVAVLVLCSMELFTLVVIRL